jgi:hypothetical protein
MGSSEAWFSIPADTTRVTYPDLEFRRTEFPNLILSFIAIRRRIVMAFLFHGTQGFLHEGGSADCESERDCLACAV